jgi:hypothetical protein
VAALLTYPQFSQTTASNWSADTQYVFEGDVFELSALELLDTITLALTSNGGVEFASALDPLDVLDLGGGVLRYNMESTARSIAPAGAVGLVLGSDNVPGLIGSIRVDRTGLDSALVPEPTTGLRLGLGLAVLAAGGRIRRRSWMRVRPGERNGDSAILGSTAFAATS